MAHIALIMTGLTGNLNSSLEVASRLQSEGNQVTYVSIRDVKEKVEQHNIPYVQFPEINFSYSLGIFSGSGNRSWIKKLRYHLANRDNILEKSKALLHLSTYEKALMELKVDKALIDKELHDLIFVCHKLNLPVTILSTWFSNNRGTGTKLPPLRTSIIPKQGWKGSALGIFLSWMVVKLRVFARILRHRMIFKGYRRAALLQYAKEVGFPTETLVATNLPNYFSYTNLPHISFTMAEMDFPHQPGKNFKYAGPMVFDQREFGLSNTIHSPIERIVKIKQEEGKKLIYCAASSLLSPDMSFIKKVVAAVEGQEQWLLLVSLGGKQSHRGLEVKSDNVHVLPWVPQMKVLKHADCCITHAGNNSVNECIHFSVPMLAYSGKRFDQNGCAARIHFHGLGIRGDKDKDSAFDIGQNIERIFNEPSFQQRMVFFNTKHQEYRKRKLTPLLN